MIISVAWCNGISLLYVFCMFFTLTVALSPSLLSILANRASLDSYESSLSRDALFIPLLISYYT